VVEEGEEDLIAVGEGEGAAVAEEEVSEIV